MTRGRATGGVAPYRVLVTGSRTWRLPAVVDRALDEVAIAHPGLHVVHGFCPAGADLFAELWCRARDVKPERHPAQWARLGRSAGMVRNQVMVESGPDECLAFIAACTDPRCRRTDPHGSHGATGCADAADAAGIPTRRYEVDAAGLRVGRAGE